MYTQKIYGRVLLSPPSLMCPISTFPTSANRYPLLLVSYISSQFLDFFFFFFFYCIMPRAGSQFHDQGSNPHPLQWKVKVSTTGPPGKSSCQFPYAVEVNFKMCIYYLFNPPFHTMTHRPCWSMLTNVSTSIQRDFLFILFLEIVLLYGYTIIYLTSSLLTDTSKASKLLLLQTMQQLITLISHMWTYVYEIHS